MNNILFVFEGKETESRYVSSLNENILGKTTIIECVYAGDIYQLYATKSTDSDLDTFELLKERCKISDLHKSKAVLDKYTRDDIAEIYLFFDYDGHATKADDEKIKEMLTMFDNETEQGKLYISYPMVEAIKHIKDFSEDNVLEVKCKGQNCPAIDQCDNREACKKEPHYKSKSGMECLSILNQIRKYDKDLWIKIIMVHLSRMNDIVNDSYHYPSKLEHQTSIFESQLRKFISKECPTVAVLSAFPVFIHDYFGNEKTKIILQGS